MQIMEGLSFVADPLGAGLNYLSNRENNRQNEADRALSAQQFEKTHALSRKQFYANEARNRELSRQWERQFTSTIQARVKDAEAAGISPMAALGIPGTAPQAISTSTSLPGSTAGRARTTSIFDDMNKFVSMKMYWDMKKSEAESKKTEEEVKKEKFNNLVKIGVVQPDIPIAMNELPAQNIPTRPDQWYYDNYFGWFEGISPEFAEVLDSMWAPFYMGAKQVGRNLEDFWDDSKYIRNELTDPNRYK